MTTERELREFVRRGQAAQEAADKATQAKHVLIDIEDCKRQLFHRFEVNGVVVLVDGTPEDDPAIGQTIDLLLATPDLVAALEGLADSAGALRDSLLPGHSSHSAAAMLGNVTSDLQAAKVALAKAEPKGE